MKVTFGFVHEAPDVVVLNKGSGEVRLKRPL